MIIKTYIAGPIQANNYLVIDENSKEAVLIDCSECKQEIIDEVEKEGLKVKYILLTHGHFDHVLGVNDMQKDLEAPAFIAKEDIPQLETTSGIMAAFGLSGATNPVVENTFQDGDEFSIGDTKIKVLATPGHTKGGVCFLVNDSALFSGDTLFKECFGRTDLMGGDFQKLKSSIRDVIFPLDENIQVYPGHGPSTTIAHEKEFNEINNYR